MKRHLLGLSFGLITFVVGLIIPVHESQPIYTIEVQRVVIIKESQYTNEFEIGKLEALQDLQQGKRIYRRCERNCVWTELTAEFEHIMTNQYGVKVEAIDSCSFNGSSRERTDGYNSVQIAALEKLFGAGVIDKAQHQAFIKFQSKYEK